MLTSVTRGFDVAKFSAQLHEEIDDLAIAYFSIGAATLESVQKKLIFKNRSKAIDSAKQETTALLSRQRTVFASQDTGTS